MANSNKFLAMSGMIIFTAFGILIAHVLENMITGINSNGIPKEFKNFILTPGLIDGLFWLVVCILVYLGIQRIYSKKTNVRPISLFFLLLWLSAVFGLFLGNLIWILFSNKSVTIDLNLIINSLFLNLENSLGPAFAGTLGMANNGKSNNKSPNT